MVTTVLVTDGEQRSALAVVRSLARAGYRCIVGSASGRSIAGASRGAQREYALADPQADPARFVDDLLGLIEREDVGLLLPITEASLLAVLPERDRLDAALPFTGIEMFRRICDKREVLEVAVEAGIRVPRQHVLSAPGEPVPAGLPFPVVAKPTRSVVTAADGRRQKVGVRWARSHDELTRVLAAYPRGAYPILLQEAVDGPGVGVFVLLWTGRVLGSFSHRRIREKPPSGGVSVVRDSEPMDPALLEKSLALLQRFDWEGVAMVEYKLDAATGEPVLMEINGRFWGSLQLAIDAGVDFPRLLAEVALGQAVTSESSYRQVRSRWLWGDVDHLIARWREDPAIGARARALGTFLAATRPGVRHELLRLRDLGPFLRESRYWLRDALGSRLSVR